MKNSKLKNVQGSTFFSDGIHGGTETKRLSVSLLQIGGADARNLAEIKRRHVPKYTSMYILGLRVCNANSLLHRTTAVHGGIDTLSIFSSGTDAARIMQKRCFGTAETRH